MIVSIVISIIGVLWLGFMMSFPEKWNNFVDKENGFWIKKGLVTESTAEKFARFEKGLVLKIIIIIGVLLSLADAFGLY